MIVFIVAALLFLPVAGSSSARRLSQAWTHRRHLQLFILVAPACALLLGLVILRLCFARAISCFTQLADCLTGTGWQIWPQTILGALGVMGLIASLLAVARLAILGWIVQRRSVPATGDLQRSVAELAEQIGVALPRVRIWAVDRPLAFTCGLMRPTIVLSPWMVRHLDQRELEAVITHELAHVGRQDQRVLVVATWLRDAFWYLPTSRLAWRQLHLDQELACDDLAIRVTNRPLALASALAKVWYAGVAMPGQGYAPALIDDTDALETRIARLTELPDATVRASVAPAGDATSLRTVAIQYAAILVTLASCGLMATVWWLL